VNQPGGMAWTIRYARSASVAHSMIGALVNRISATTSTRTKMFKFLDNLTRCKYTMEIKEMQLVVCVCRCYLPPNHPGVHRSVNHRKVPVYWITNIEGQRMIDEKGLR
jgi:hypothetical protein